MERNEINEKFIAKNQETVDKLRDFLLTDNDISAIVMSNELSVYLQAFPEAIINRVNGSELYKFCDKRVVIDTYTPSKVIRFIRKSESISFDIPCVCGYFNDEEHGNRLR
jgi:hypothetical protein